MTFQGSAWKPNDLERSLIRVKEECPNAVLVFLRDNDAPGEKKAQDFQEACDRVLMASSTTGLATITKYTLGVRTKFCL